MRQKSIWSDSGNERKQSRAETERIHVPGQSGGAYRPARPRSALQVIVRVCFYIIIIVEGH